MADQTEAVFQQMRRDFEAAMRAHYPIWSFASDGCGGYHNERTELAWQGWMACFLHMSDRVGESQNASRADATRNGGA
jgi:hypothetical protein